MTQELEGPETQAEETMSSTGESLELSESPGREQKKLF